MHSTFALNFPFHVIIRDYQNYTKKYKFMKMMTAPFLLTRLIVNFFIMLLMNLESMMYLIKPAPNEH
jgi:hypothetical protein